MSNIKTYHPHLVEHFVGRLEQKKRLLALERTSEAMIVIVHGRRRIGKTELLEQTFGERHLLKFEGIQNQSEEDQRRHVIMQLAEYTGEPLLRHVTVNSWVEIFKLIAKYVSKGEWTIYFEELQWLANYHDRFIAELKYVWDNYFRKNSKLILILCGSSPSFMINHVVKSKALYNRSQYELPLKELNLIETKEFLQKRSEKETMDAYLTVGGIPEYLKWLNKDSSVFLSLCQHAFVSGSPYAQEYTKIFTSSMADNKHYKTIIDFLSQRKFATRDEILKHLKLATGGGISEVLSDLIECGFIGKYIPFDQSPKTRTIRYCVTDNYLQFYYKFVYPILDNINNGDYDSNPTAAINTNAYTQWCGYAFERFCRRYHWVIAKILGFSAVRYHYGAYFKRGNSTAENGFQIDLIFERADRVFTVVEIKYQESKVGTKVIEQVESKLENLPNPKNNTIEKVLIAFNGVDEALKNYGYFDRFIDKQDLFNPIYWQR